MKKSILAVSILLASSLCTANDYEYYQDDAPYAQSYEHQVVVKQGVRLTGREAYIASEAKEKWENSCIRDLNNAITRM